jgi:hypothetical protein
VGEPKCAQACLRGQAGDGHEEVRREPWWVVAGPVGGPEVIHIGVQICSGHTTFWKC